MNKDYLYALQTNEGFVSVITSGGVPMVMPVSTTEATAAEALNKSVLYYWHQIGGLRELLMKQNIAFRVLPTRKWNGIRQRWEKFY